MSLRVWTDGTDWVIAESLERAYALAHEACGASPGELGDADDWAALPSDRTVRIHDQRTDVVEERTAAEWIAHEGNKEGFLCSTEW